MTSCSVSDGEIPVTKKKRGVVHPETYKRNVVRTARLHGEEYVNFKGNKVASKTIPTKLTCKCLCKCYQRIPEEAIKEIWTNFYSMKSKNVQDTYLQTLVTSRTIVRRRLRRNNKPTTEMDDPSLDDTTNVEKTQNSFKRNHAFLYRVKVNGEFQTVCKNVFLQVHGVSGDRVFRICKLLLSNETPSDKRGGNRSGNAIPNEVCRKVDEHMRQFEVSETHYGGELVKYLDSKLNVKKMHQMFLRQHPDLEGKVKYSFYYTYFRDNFGYSFGHPQENPGSLSKSFVTKVKDPISENPGSLSKSFVTKVKDPIGENPGSLSKSFVTKVKDLSGERNLDTEIMDKESVKKFYSLLKDSEENTDDDTVAVFRLPTEYALS